ncbi:MAG: NUDIX hydrolase [Eubacteriales bacterium]
MGGAFVVICNYNKILLVKRTDAPLWDLPGGAIEKDETEIQAAIRETQEETGYIVDTEYKIGEYTRFGRNDAEHLFYAKICGGEAISKGLETAKLKWFDKHSLPFLTVPRRKRQIRDYFKGYKDVNITLKESIINILLKSNLKNKLRSIYFKRHNK